MKIWVILALVMTQTLCERGYLKFAHFALSSSADSLFPLKIVTSTNVTINLEPTSVSDYYEVERLDGNQALITVMIRDKNSQKFEVGFTESNRATVVFTYPGGKIEAQVLEDIALPLKQFKSLNRANKSTYPYQDNCFWRLVVLYNSDTVVSVKNKGASCRDCIYSPREKFRQTTYYSENAGFPKDIKIQNNGSELFTELQGIQFQSFGIYTIYVWHPYASKEEYRVVADFKPENAVIQFVFLCVYIAFWIVYRLIRTFNRKKKGNKRYFESRRIQMESTEDNSTTITAFEKEDYPWIDTFRGFSVVLYVFVKSGGGNFLVFNPSLWQGFTIGDLPEYMIAWTMGFCTALSLFKKISTDSKAEQIKGYLGRALFLVGLSNSL